MRILHLSVLYPPVIQGGAERFAATLAEEQAKRGHDVGVVTLGRQQEPVHEQNGVEVHRISHSNLFWLHDWPNYPAPARYIHKFFASWNPVTSAAGSVGSSIRFVRISSTVIAWLASPWTAGRRPRGAASLLYMPCMNSTCFAGIRTRFGTGICAPPSVWHVASLRQSVGTAAMSPLLLE